MAETRRRFLQAATAGAAAMNPAQPVSANDRIRVASIGTGGMGMGNAHYAAAIPGVELVAVCDLYDSRLTRARELFGSGIATTRDYHEILARKDVDAVIVSTPDHWHSRITIEALDAGKDVFCEKPMVQTLEQGKPVIGAQERSGRILQIGSQYATNTLFHQVNELMRSGALGPTRVSATGGLRFWKDGRDSPDVLIGVLDYPRTDAHPPFNVVLRGHFKTGGLPGTTFVFRFVGSEGQAVITGASSLVLSKVPDESEPGYIIDSFSQATQEAFLREYRKKYPGSQPGIRPKRPVSEERRSLPKGYDAHREHHKVFYDAVRSRKRPLQDAVFGFRVAGPSLLCNRSQAERREFRWDPVSMTVAV